MATRKSPARPKAKTYYIGFDTTGSLLYSGEVAGSDYVFPSAEALKEAYDTSISDGTWSGNVIVAKVVSAFELVKSIEEVTPESILEGEE